VPDSAFADGEAKSVEEAVAFALESLEVDAALAG
jgi:hypothetical protein